MVTRKELYYETLKDPLWRQRRDDVMYRDAYSCTTCGTTKHLQVHHQYYEDNKLPWEYPDDCLVTLCETCHGLLHEKNDMRKDIEMERGCYGKNAVA